MLASLAVRIRLVVTLAPVIAPMAALGTAHATAWTEVGDAPSHPDLPAQVTRGDGALTRIVGATGGADLRDAYCIRIDSPGSFQATTDPSTAAGASADFDTRLYLFGAHGGALIANDDTPPSTAPFRSTLTATATDGSGFTLASPGDYTLVVAGASDDPLDPDDTALFDLGADAGAVHAADPDAGRFDGWLGGAPATGTYTVVLDGASPCQHQLDVLLTEVPSSPFESRACPGDGTGSFRTCQSFEVLVNGGAAIGFFDGDAYPDVAIATIGDLAVCRGGVLGFDACTLVPESTFWNGVATGRVDSDARTDLVMVGNGRTRACLGDGAGGFPFCGGLGVGSGLDVALGYMDGDAALDAVVARGVATGHSICLGSGAGTFACSDFEPNPTVEGAVALGFLNTGDLFLDVVLAQSNAKNRVCLGDGEGGILVCADVNGDTNDTLDVALGDVNGDTYVDAVFANRGQANRVCLGAGTGGFSSCTNVSDDTNRSLGVDLGLIDEDDHLDVVFANESEMATISSRVCFGQGDGTFADCADIAPPPAGNSVALGVALGELGPFYLFTDGFESEDTCGWASTTPTGSCPP